jgi:hypothetical protein
VSLSRCEQALLSTVPKFSSEQREKPANKRKQHAKSSLGGLENHFLTASPEKKLKRVLALEEKTQHGAAISRRSRPIATSDLQSNPALSANTLKKLSAANHVANLIEHKLNTMPNIMQNTAFMSSVTSPESIRSSQIGYFTGSDSSSQPELRE